MSAPHSSHTRRYRTELDGLRALAALLVIAYHAGMGSVVGGYVGVDVFFVLSGFLITGLLIDSAGRGPRALLAFYARRMQRLLPAALVVLVVTAAIWTAVAGSVERDPIVGDLRAAALYFANWHFAAQATDYFAVTNAPSPVIHFWSLSAEEQFYLVWPALVMLVMALRPGRSGRRWLAGLAGVLASGSLASLIIATTEGSQRSYYGTDCRAYQLLAGALLALWARGRRPRSHLRGPTITAHLGQALTLSTLVVITTSAVDLGPTPRGIAATACAVVLLWSLELAPAGITGRILSRPTPSYLGKISYGTYLWHWPVILLIRRFAVISPHYLFVTAAAVSIGLASASYRVLEQPLRRSPALSRYAAVVCTLGLASSVTVGIVLAPRLLASDRHPVVLPISTAQSGDDRSLALPAAGESARLPKVPTHTPVPSAAALRAAGKVHPKRTCLKSVTRLGCLARSGAGPTVLVIGDSHLESFFPVLDDLGAKHDLTLYTWMYYVCPWQRDALPQGTNSAPCRDNKAPLYQELLPQVRPDAVIVINRGYDDPNYPRPMVLDGRSSPTDPATVLTTSTPGAVKAILDDAQKFVEIEPWPSLRFSQRECLARVPYAEQCRGRAAGKLASESAIEQRAGQDPRVKSISLDDAVCPNLPTCDPVVRGVVTRIDNDHLTAAFAESLEPVLDTRLTAAGVFG